MTAPSICNEEGATCKALDHALNYEGHMQSMTIKNFKTGEEVAAVVYRRNRKQQLLTFRYCPFCAGRILPESFDFLAGLAVSLMGDQ